jgi:hypothetical protein
MLIQATSATLLLWWMQSIALQPKPGTNAKD